MRSFFSWKKLLSCLTGNLCQGREAQLYNYVAFFYSFVILRMPVVGASVAMVPTLHTLEGVKMESQ